LIPWGHSEVARMRFHLSIQRVCPNLGSFVRHGGIHSLQCRSRHPQLRHVRSYGGRQSPVGLHSFNLHCWSGKTYSQQWCWPVEHQ
jgi:hypothetical protein